jgi:Protein of unknown function (DUF1194)
MWIELPPSARCGKVHNRDPACPEWTMNLKGWFTSLAIALPLSGGMPSAVQTATGQIHDAGAAKVDMLLCLAADASESVNEFEYRLQRFGHAAAIADAEVIDAIRNGAHGRIAVTYFEWARPDQQYLGVDWQIVDSEASARQLAGRIRDAPTPPWISYNVRDTSTGDAVRYCLKQFAASPFSAGRRVIDISSDGTSNAGVRINDVRDLAVAQGIVINVLAISRPIDSAHAFDHTRPRGGLVNYFAQNVAGGQGSFVEAATGYQSFADMMKRKFLVEIARAE